MKVTIEELFSGLGIKYNNIVYKSTKEYTEPFFNKLQGIATKYNIYVIPYNQSIINGNIKYNVYTKVSIQAILPNKQVIGMVYGINSKIPEIKFYSGILNEYSCLCIPLKIIYNNFDSINYDCIHRFIDTYNPHYDYIEQLKCIPFNYSNNNILKCLGNWICQSIHCVQYNGKNKIKLSTSIPINAYKMLIEIPSSKYYISKDSNMYNVYNAFIEAINNTIKKDPLNIYEKTLLLQRILNLPKLV